jgi:hypothetical protein
MVIDVTCFWLLFFSFLFLERFRLLFMSLIESTGHVRLTTKRENELRHVRGSASI